VIADTADIVIKTVAETVTSDNDITQSGFIVEALP
jgi:hypothetical protein